MVKTFQAGQIKRIMQIKQNKCRSSGSYMRYADQADYADRSSRSCMRNAYQTGKIHFWILKTVQINRLYLNNKKVLKSKTQKI